MDINLKLRGGTPYAKGGGVDHTIVVEISCYDEETDPREIAQAVEEALVRALPMGSIPDVIDVFPGYTGKDGLLRR